MNCRQCNESPFHCGCTDCRFCLEMRMHPVTTPDPVGSPSHLTDNPTVEDE